MISLRTALILLCVCTLLAFNTTSSMAEETSNPQKTSETKVEPATSTDKVKNMDMSRFIESTGSVEATRMAQLASPAEGPIIESKIHEGDSVEKDAILVRIGRTRSTEAFLQSAFEDLKREEQETRNVQQLVNSGAIPAEQLTIANANLKKARAQAAKLRESLEDFDIKAPWTGIVSKILVQDGNFVAPRTTLVEMYDPSSLVIRFAVPEAQSALVRNGLAVTLKLDAYPDKEIKAAVTRVYPELDRKTRTLTVEATPETALKLKPGMFARLQLRLVHESGALVVPTTALRFTASKEPYVIAIVADRAEYRSIVLGMKGNDVVQIRKGVTLGEDILIQGANSIAHGAPLSLASAQNQRQH